MKRRFPVKLRLLILIFIFTCNMALAQTSALTFQGKLNDGGTAANGAYDFVFKLFSVASGGTQIGSNVVRDDVPVTNGTFAVNLDFGSAAFTSATANYIEISVRAGSSTGGYTMLAPRQLITNSPYSIKSISADNAISATNATTAANAMQLGGIAANQYVLTTDGRLSDSRAPLPNSANYIQNTTSPQSSSNFNISGNGTIGGTLNSSIVNAAAQFNIGGDRILSNAGSENLFAGAGAGTANVSGIENAFFGRFAGNNNNAGSGNSFFGFVAGRFTTGGSNNSFFGNRVGIMNSSGNFNSFFGHRAGESSNGSSNSFFGTGAGLINNSGNSNSFFGHDAGNFNSSGSFNVVIGDNADLGLQNLTNAVAIGANALVSQNNSLVLGSISGVNNATADTFVGIGTTAPSTKFHLNGTGIIRARINSDSNAGLGLALNEQSLWSVAAVSPGHFQIFNDRIGQNAMFISTFDNSVNTGTLNVSGIITVTSLGNVGSTALCRNASNQISLCSSSIRYKSNINGFSPGLNLVKRLRPVSFNWKADNREDFGLVAEEVADVEPLLVTRNEKGEVEGVKYDRVGIVLINAVKEQQAQIDLQQKLIAEQRNLIEQQAEKLEGQQSAIEKQRSELEALKKLVCSINRTAEICQPKK